MHKPLTSKPQLPSKRKPQCGSTARQSRLRASAARQARRGGWGVNAQGGTRSLCSEPPRSISLALLWLYEVFGEPPRGRKSTLNMYDVFRGGGVEKIWRVSCYLFMVFFCSFFLFFFLMLYFSCCDTAWRSRKLRSEGAVCLEPGTKAIRLLYSYRSRSFDGKPWCVQKKKQKTKNHRPHHCHHLLCQCCWQARARSSVTWMLASDVWPRPWSDVLYSLTYPSFKKGWTLTCYSVSV